MKQVALKSVPLVLNQSPINDQDDRYSKLLESQLKESENIVKN
jgi:hypothetical protein